MKSDFTLRALVGRKEDHLTAIFALALELDEDFRAAATSLLMASLPSPKPHRPHVVGIEVQRSFSTGDCPDMALTLDDGRVVLVENKLEAPETVKTLSDSIAGDTDGEAAETATTKTAQLERYLNLPGVAGLVFIRSTYKKVSPAVLEHQRYLHPASGATHFLWRDLYPVLESCSQPVSRWLSEAFVAHDFTPPTATIGDLSKPERRRNMQKLLEPSADMGRDMGWTVGRGSICELGFSRVSEGPADSVWVNPKTERLLVRLYPRTPDHVNQVLQAAHDIVSALNELVPVDIKPRRVRQKDVVDISTPMKAIVEFARDTSEVEARFMTIIKQVLQTLTK